jgi:Caspase domain
MKAFFAVFSVLVGCVVSVPADAQNRVALVIGNSDYRHVGILSNTRNDAGDVAASLRRLSFSVQELSDATHERMRTTLIEFSQRARRAEIAAVFFAGHGLEVNGENYLVPVDASMRTDVSVAQEGVALKTILPIVSNASALGLVILDACRNNPFLAKMERTVRGRALSVSPGLARVEPTGSVLVAYSAKDGTVASDGQGNARNSPFTSALLKYLEEPLEINFVFRNVRDDVIVSTRNDQEPFVYGSLSKKEIYLKTRAGGGKVIPDTPTGDVFASGNVWDHNGSRMKEILSQGLHTFIYDKPREGLIRVGVKPGTVGVRVTNRNGIYEGTAYVFSRTCGAVAYPVSGNESFGRQRITVKGPRPYVDPQTCQPVTIREETVDLKMIE